jgi:hypothetical protein
LPWGFTDTFDHRAATTDTTIIFLFFKTALKFLSAAAFTRKSSRLNLLPVANHRRNIGGVVSPHLINGD